MQPSIHQPSRMLSEGTPFSAAFMPLVPEASIGGWGVLTHTIHTAGHAACPMVHVIII